MRQCVASPQRLLVVGSSTKTLRSVTFFDGDRKIATQRKNAAGLFAADWKTKGLAKGAHELRAILRDAAGRTDMTTRAVRVCK